MKKNWKQINKIDFLNAKECLRALKEKNYKTSLWVENIFESSDFNYDKIDYPINLIRISLKELGFDIHAELKNVYKKIEEKGLDLVPPQIALYSRMIYDEQPTGEWLRFATPLDSMIDIDGIPHLPKIGKALGFYFIETYWAYENAIFHPHNEFVFLRKNQ